MQCDGYAGLWCVLIAAVVLGIVFLQAAGRILWLNLPSQGLLVHPCQGGWCCLVCCLYTMGLGVIQGPQGSALLCRHAMVGSVVPVYFQ